MKEKINKLIEISKYLNDNESAIQLKELLEDDSYMLSVMGEFSAGKSSLINNLFGKQILPVHRTETTACVTFIKYGETESVSLIYENGNSKFISLEDSLEMWQTGEKIDLLADIESIVITLPSDLLKNGLIIADTPGTNTIIDKHIDITKKLIAKTDRIVYVLGKQITESDKRFVKEIEDSGIGVIFVRTYMDQVKSNEENISETIEEEKTILSELSSEESFFVSNIKENVFFNEISNLKKYISCTIAENIYNAIRNSVANKVAYIIKKQEGKILDRRMELNMVLNEDKEKYQQVKQEILSALKILEQNLEQKREKIKDKYAGEKISAKEELKERRKQEEKKLIVKINNTLEDEFTDEYQDRLEQMVRESCIRMRDEYVDCFERIIRDNKAEFIEEMKQQNELSIYIPDIPDSLDESDYQFKDLRDRMIVLRETQNVLKEELDKIELSDAEFQSEKENLEEERQDIQESIDDIQKQLDDFPPYVKKYILVEGNHSYEKVFKKVGTFVDWATIFIPGKAWAKVGSKILGASSKGAKILKMSKSADAFADGARILAKVANVSEEGAKGAKIIRGFEKGKKVSKFEKEAKVAIKAIDNMNKAKKEILANKLGEQLCVPVSEFDSNPYDMPDDFSPIVSESPKHKHNCLDWIELEYWFAKLGKRFDTPDTKKEDLEYKNKYDSAKQEIERDKQLQIEKELEKRKQIEDIKSKEDENRLLKEITMRKERSAQEQIQELEKEIEREKKAVLLNRTRNHYIEVAKDNLSRYEDYIMKELLPEINEKMENYINTYDFRIKDDILAKKKELDELDRKFNSSERAGIEEELMICKEYSDFLETAMI